jgi:hypothetical protein
MTTKEKSIVIGILIFIILMAILFYRKLDRMMYGDPSPVSNQQNQFVPQPANIKRFEYNPLDFNVGSFNLPDIDYVKKAFVQPSLKPTVELNNKSCGGCDAINKGVKTITSPIGLTGTEAIINTNYNVLFGRNAEAGGLAYWSSAVSKGILSLGELFTSIAKGARNEDVAAKRARFGDAF